MGDALKTQDELVERYRKISSRVLDFESGVIGEFLDFDHAKQFLKEDSDATPETWDKALLKADRETVIKELTDYMEFAVGKALDHRGLSSGRSINKMRGWMWLLSNNEMIDFIDDGSHYAMYGCPILKKIILKYDLVIPEATDNEYFDNMADGNPCHSGCDEC